MDMPIYEALFVLMPLMHSESLHDHKTCLESFKALHAHAVAKIPEVAESILGFVKFEQDHYGVIERFGRYPSRNQLLNRESTPEEIEFLKTHKGW